MTHQTKRKYAKVQHEIPEHQIIRAGMEIAKINL